MSETQTLKVTGMTCGHCAKTVERAAAGVAGVEAARVDLASATLTLSGNADRGALVHAIRDAGYDVKEN